MDYVALKTLFRDTFAEESDALAHVHLGLAIWLAASLITRRPLWTRRPLLAVLGMQILNECADCYIYGSWRWEATLADTVQTLFWPTLLYLWLSRIVRKMIVQSRRQGTVQCQRFASVSARKWRESTHEPARRHACRCT